MKDRDGEIQRLRAQCDTLNRQIQMLVRMERDYCGYQRQAEEQIRRINMLNAFAMRGRQSFDPDEIGGFALDTLIELLVMDQGVVFGERGGKLWLQAVRAVAGKEGESAERLARGWPMVTVRDPLASEPRVVRGGEISDSSTLGECVASMQALFGCVVPTADSLFVTLPVGTSRSPSVGLILLRITEPTIRSYHDLLPGPDDIPFLELMTSHVSGVLDNAVLHQGMRLVTEQLEDRVVRRTRQLAEANANLDLNLSRLRETQNELLHAGRMAAIGTLAAGLSHELNNPMSVILGYGQWMLRDESRCEPEQQALKAIVRHARRCASLVDALLDFSRKRPSTRDVTGVRQLLLHVMDLARMRAATCHVTLTLGEARDTDRVSISRVEMESALLNLVNNALDAVGDNGQVALSAEGQTRDGRAGVLLVIQDSGDGIPDGVLDQIFDPFFTTKAVGKGTGLGLSLALRIVESHGGTIDFETTVGAGTTARVWLPLAAEPV